ncbi:MAG: hypothetical protein HC905_21680 [Bacteroidales bacterium]|nr:hypothetical protein [Bacteroidales bacterium]
MIKHLLFQVDKFITASDKVRGYSPLFDMDYFDLYPNGFMDFDNVKPRERPVSDVKNHN